MPPLANNAVFAVEGDVMMDALKECDCHWCKADRLMFAQTEVQP